MSIVKHFRELRVYREAFESAMQIFEHSNGVSHVVRLEKMRPNTNSQTPIPTHSHTHTLTYSNTVFILSIKLLTVPVRVKERGNTMRPIPTYSYTCSYTQIYLPRLFCPFPQVA